MRPRRSPPACRLPPRSPTATAAPVRRRPQSPLRLRSKRSPSRANLPATGVPETSRTRNLGVFPLKGIRMNIHAAVPSFERALREENDFLRERVRQLEELLKPRQTQEMVQVYV